MIKIICVGKLKEKYLVDAIKEYKKRISKYNNIEIIELPDEAGFDKKVIIKKESDRVKKYIDQKAYTILLDLQGEQLSSVDFSKKIDSLFIHYSNITFIIGGSYGVSEDIKQISNSLISFSKMTFPHQLFRIMLLEQIYRSFKIMNNETYHK